MSDKRDNLDPIAVDERRAAAMLGVSPRTVYAMRKAGELPFIRVGRNLIRYRVDELRAWALRQQEKVTA